MTRDDSQPRELEIVRLGSGGDGVAETADGPRYVPQALPGERWQPAADGIWTQLTQSAERATPACRHFGTCGGCSAQHMSDALYARWKRDIVASALAHRGLEIEPAMLQRVPTASRRRAVLAATRTPRAFALGFHEARAQTVVDIAECPVLAPQIVEALPVLREMARRLTGLKNDLRLTVTATQSGLSVAATGARAALTAEDRAHLAALAEAHRLAAITVDGEEVVQRARPEFLIAGVAVRLPPGVFVQAVAEAEIAMAQLVIAAAARAKSVADLFSGLGTFALPLARRARVLAIDNDEAALAALAEARRNTQGLKPIETRRRDLMREPLSRKELEPFDCVVFDPPRAGAKAQCEMLAKSKVAKVIAVSCDPGTLARDLRILVDGGYRLDAVTPIDQFVWSPHVEAVAVLSR